MSFLSTSHLRNLLPDCIEPYIPANLQNVSYELTLGSEVFLTDSKNGKKEILNANNTQVVINAGQFALLLTKEKVKIPNDKIAFISIKAGEKLKGLVNISGFHVDPGFYGQLLFSVYNAGPSPIILDMGKPYFLIWFCELTAKINDSDSYDSQKGAHQNQSDIPTRYIEHLKSGELASPNVLLERAKWNEYKLEKVFWAFGILISLTVGILIKIYYDDLQFNNGYQSGLKDKTTKEEVHQVVKQLPLDSIIVHKVDSILSVKLKNVKSNP